MLNITKKQSDGRLTVALEGRIDVATASDLEQEVMSCLDGVTELVFDLEKLVYISSAGLRVLLATFKQMKVAKGTMVLANVGENFKDVLQNTGLDAVFGVF